MQSVTRLPSTASGEFSGVSRDAGAGAGPLATSPEVSARFSRHPRRDTRPELALRRELHRRGFRYRIDAAPLAGVRRRADLVFPGVKVAVFVDGCFWHGCPAHLVWPKANADWWRNKITGNVARDRDTDRRLVEQGWRVVRVWEHEDPRAAASEVAGALRSC